MMNQMNTKHLPQKGVLSRKLGVALVLSLMSVAALAQNAIRSVTGSA